ncbi:haloacid dehalogenase type II [Erwinia sp. 198]|uniref:haloacid dehalogenase type II n=1 Tax=Erwinia sp. 198 TaxID=2022746 RepID=UPI000F66DBB3|nr:haloacid dehalogenase type II [Erwinia sp. 198]RRZ86809.1 haloacid dehalogenase type II [Erwinia sp. 198]
MGDKIIVFDVNETLLDTEALNPMFERVFGDERIMRQWFSELIIYSQSFTLSGGYAPFAELAVAVLRMVADIKGATLSEHDINEFRERLATLPAHPDALPALEMLRAAGFRLMTLTNSSTQAGQKVLEQSGLAHFFEKQFSVEEVKRFKPAAENYTSVAQTLGVSADLLRLVAAHSWDLLGATACGWKGALVARPGNAVLRVGKQPDIVEKDLIAVAHRIISIDGAG